MGVGHPSARVRRLRRGADNHGMNTVLVVICIWGAIDVAVIGVIALLRTRGRAERILDLYGVERPPGGPQSAPAPRHRGAAPVAPSSEIRALRGLQLSGIGETSVPVTDR